ncbi:MAG: HU family DNA-binding protein [bacterium]
MATRTKADIVDMISERTGVMQKDVSLCMEELLKVITEVLEERDRIEIRGLGVFKTKKRNARIAKHPKTKEEIQVPERVVPLFKPSKILKEKVEKANK